MSKKTTMKDQQLQPRNPTRSNALKCAEYCKAQAQGFKDTPSAVGSRFTLDWYSSAWLYGYSGVMAAEVLDELVEEGLLVKEIGKFYRLA